MEIIDMMELMGWICQQKTVSHQNLGIGRQEDPTKEPDVLLAGLRWRTWSHPVEIWKAVLSTCHWTKLPTTRKSLVVLRQQFASRVFMVRIDRDKWWSTSSIAKSGLLQSIPGLTLSPGIRVSTQLICLVALPADQRRLDDSSRLLASILQMLFLIPTQRRDTILDID